jgi:hypothetical protein
VYKFVVRLPISHNFLSNQGYFLFWASRIRFSTWISVVLIDIFVTFLSFDAEMVGEWALLKLQLPGFFSKIMYMWHTHVNTRARRIF